MQQIDQDPRDYRAKSVKGEPVFQVGAGKRVAVWAAVFVFLLGLAVLVQFLFGGAAASVADTVTGWFFNSTP